MIYKSSILLLVSFWISCNSRITKNHENSIVWWTEVDRQHILNELDRTTSELQNEVANLSYDQWHFTEDSTRWSIAEITEHLEMQNQLHYREITVMSKAPQHVEFRSITFGKDDHFTKYSTDPVKSEAKWFLQPRQRYKLTSEGWEAFSLARTELRKFVAETDIDLRKQFTFRTSVSARNVNDLTIGDVRDLHQLLLTGIAHTDRHLRQIRTIKQHPSFPNNPYK